jgi:hypothetical protein
MVSAALAVKSGQDRIAVEKPARLRIARLYSALRRHLESIAKLVLPVSEANALA